MQLQNYVMDVQTKLNHEKKEREVDQAALTTRYVILFRGVKGGGRGNYKVIWTKKEIICGLIFRSVQSRSVFLKINAGALEKLLSSAYTLLF